MEIDLHRCLEANYWAMARFNDIVQDMVLYSKARKQSQLNAPSSNMKVHRAATYLPIDWAGSRLHELTRTWLVEFQFCPPSALDFNQVGPLKRSGFDHSKQFEFWHILPASLSFSWSFGNYSWSIRYRSNSVEWSTSTIHTISKMTITNHNFISIPDIIICVFSCKMTCAFQRAQLCSILFDILACKIAWMACSDQGSQKLAGPQKHIMGTRRVRFHLLVR